MNKSGWLISMLISEDGLIIKLFKLFTIGILWHNLTSSLVFGIWKFNISISIGYNSKYEINDYGIS